MRIFRRNTPKEPVKTVNPPVVNAFCDRCGDTVKAAFAVAVGTQGILHFCGHHYRKHLNHIIESGYHSEQLTEAP